MIITKPDDGAGLLYHVIDLNGQTVHAYRDLETCVHALEGDQRIAIWDERYHLWRNRPTRTTSDRPVAKGVLGYGPNRERRVPDAAARRYAGDLIDSLREDGDATVVGRTFGYNDRHELMVVKKGGKFYLGCTTLDAVHWERYFGVRVS